jgi:hypothetical protein
MRRNFKTDELVKLIFQDSAFEDRITGPARRGTHIIPSQIRLDSLNLSGLEAEFGIRPSLIASKLTLSAVGDTTAKAGIASLENSGPLPQGWKSCHVAIRASGGGGTHRRP